MSSHPSDPSEESETAASPVFIHDFLPLEIDITQAVGRFTGRLTPALVAQLLVDSWNAETRAATSAGLVAFPCSQSDVMVTIGEVRSRRDAIVIPLRWQGCSDRWVAPLEADLELASFGANRCHLHLLGRSRLPENVTPHSGEASLHHRFAVAIVRHLLASLRSEVFELS